MKRVLLGIVLILLCFWIRWIYFTGFSIIDIFIFTVILVTIAAYTEIDD